MGVCLSRCGDAQHKAGVVAATISHSNSLEPMTTKCTCHHNNGTTTATTINSTCAADAADAAHSLKTFLHLYEIAEASKRSFSSPRASLGDVLHIPHSSELFSLPDSDAERSSCCTPARTSRASISPKSTRNSFSVWGGRFSTDRSISVGCRKKIRPARSSKGGEHEVAAHQRLVEAIARLERLNNGKNLELRGSSFHRSDLEANPRDYLLTKSRSGEFKRHSHSSSGRHHRHSRHTQPQLQAPPQQQTPPQKQASQPQPPPKRQALQQQVLQQQAFQAEQGKLQALQQQALQAEQEKAQQGSQQQALQAEQEKAQAASQQGLQEQEWQGAVEFCKFTSCSSDDQCDMRYRISELEDLELAFAQPKSMGNLVAMAGPIIKQRPLEKSVTDFLKEVENFVSLIEAPRLSLSSEAALRESLKEEPLIITTYSRSEQEDTDSDEQFTFFEASFGASERSRNKEIANSLQRFVQSAVQNESLELAKPVTEEETPVAPPSPRPAEKGSPEKQMLSIYEDPVIESKRPGKGADAARPVLTDVDTNIIPSKTFRKSPAKMFIKTPRGLRRGLSRSLDSRDQGCCSSVHKVDFNVFRTAIAPQVAPQLAPQAVPEVAPQVAPEVAPQVVVLPIPTSPPGASLIQAESTELGVVQECEATVEPEEEITL